MKIIILGLAFFLATALSAADLAPVRFNTAFEGGSIGRVEKISDTEFRLHVAGQSNNEGRNRQATWFYVRVDGAKDRALTLVLTSFIGEHRGRPSVPMGPRLRPVFSYDGVTWTHFTEMAWDADKKEATLKFTPTADTIWIAHQPPYTTERLEKFLTELDQSPRARIEVIGRSVQGRPLKLVAVEKPVDSSVDSPSRRTIWVQAREHAWESGTSHIMEGALRFIVSDDPQAAALREEYDWVFTPMVDVDGCANGQVRYNANGWDVANWQEIDLGNKESLRAVPEIWYVKKALRDYSARKPVLILLNLHNTEMNEYLVSATWNDAVRPKLEKVSELLVAETQFDPSAPLVLRDRTVDDRTGRTKEMGGNDVPYMLMETRIGPGNKLGGLPKPADRLALGPQLLETLAKAFRE